MSGRAVEAAGDVNTLLLDKTGTITLGNRQAAEFIPLPGVSDAELADAAQLSSLADETPEGRSIVVLGEREVRPSGARTRSARGALHPIHGADAHVGRRFRRAADSQRRGGRRRAIPHLFKRQRASASTSCARQSSASRAQGGTPLVVAENARPLGVIYLKDIVKGGMRERFEQLRQHGYQDRDDYRRQPAHRRDHRARGGSGRLSRRGDARRQDGA